jgi:RNA-directed DNA polymerase
VAKDRDRKVIGPTGLARKRPDQQWLAIDWKDVEMRVRNLRQRIFRATTNGQWNKVRSLMKLMLRSYANLLLSVRKVTQENKGRRTPGIDQHLALTPKARMKLVREMLELKSWRVQPAIRMYIPKANGKTRPLGIITIKNRTAQAMVKNALEPSWEARFESHSYGFRPGRATHDAIEQCFIRLKGNGLDCWVLDADIKGALETSSYCLPVIEVLVRDHVSLLRS